MGSDLRSKEISNEHRRIRLMSNLEEKKLSSTKIFQGKLINLFLDDVKLPNGEKVLVNGLSIQGLFVLFLYYKLVKFVLLDNIDMLLSKNLLRFQQESSIKAKCLWTAQIENLLRKLDM